MAVLDGIRDTLNITQDRRVVDMKNRINLLEPMKTPLIVLLMNLRKGGAFSPKVEWLEDDLIPRTSHATTLYDATVLVITVTTGEGTFFKANDIVLNTESGEQMKVDSVSGDVITVTRGYGNTAVAASTTDDELLIIGNASAENASKPAIKTTLTVAKFNFTEIFRNPFGASRTQAQSKLYGGPDRSYQRKKLGIEHMRDIERAFWFGIKKEDTSGPRRTTGGVQSFIVTNTQDFSGSMTETTFEDFARTLFRYGNSTKMLFSAPKVLSVIQEFGLGKLQLLPRDKTFGLAINRYLSPHGELNLVRTVIFEGDVYDDYMFGVDMANLEMRVMQDTILRQNIQANDADGWVDEFLTEATLIVEQEKTHMQGSNVG